MRKTLQDAMEGMTLSGVSLSSSEKNYLEDMFKGIATAVAEGAALNNKELKMLRGMIAGINTNGDSRSESFDFIESFSTGKIGNRGGNV